jgi:hypothetical protein
MVNKKHVSKKMYKTKNQSRTRGYRYVMSGGEFHIFIETIAYRANDYQTVKIKLTNISAITTIRMIKEEINRRLGIPVDYQSLYNNKYQFLEDPHNLAHYNITSGSTLKVSSREYRPPSYISISYQTREQIAAGVGRSSVLHLDNVTRNTTIGMIKQIIMEHGIAPIEEQILISNKPQRLDDDNRTLEEYQIDDDSYLHLQLTPLPAPLTLGPQ